MTKQAKGTKDKNTPKTHNCSFEGGCNIQEGGRTFPKTASQQCGDCRLWFCDGHFEEHDCTAIEDFETAFSPQELAG